MLGIYEINLRIVSFDTGLSLEEINDYLALFESKGKVVIKGDYIKTLEIGYRIVDMCFDEENSRIFFSFNDMVQFGYLEITDNLLN